MYHDLKNRIELAEHFKMCRSTFAAYCRHYPTFPPARGMKGRFSMYSLAEVTAFFEEHAPKYAAKAHERAEVAV